MQIIKFTDLKKLLPALFIFLVPVLLLAQTPPFDPYEKEYSLRSPNHTVWTHLLYLQSENYYPEIAAQVFDPEKVGPEEAKTLAIQLKQVLDGKDLFVDLEEIPTNPDYRDSVSHKHRYILFREYPGIYVERSGNRWYFSDRTVNIIPELHQEVFPFGTDKLLQLLPKAGQKKVLGPVALWQLIGTGILFVLSFVLHKLLSLLLSFVISGFASRISKKRLTYNDIKPLAKPISLLLIALILLIFVPVLQLPIQIAHYIFSGLKILASFGGIIFFYKLVDIGSVYFEKLAAKTESTLDDQLIPLVKRALRILVVVGGALVILQNLDVNITALLAGLSIGGLAFALAAQDTLKNFFGSIMIFVDRPFQIGDWIISGDIEGTVEEVGIRSTRVRTFYNSLISVPNGNLADNTVDNMGLRVFRRYKAVVGVMYDTPPHLIDAFVQGIREIVRNHPETRKDFFEVHLNDLGASSINILVYIFFKAPSWSKELQFRHEFILSMIRLAHELGVNFAFPTQTLHIENFPEKKSLSPVYELDSAQAETKIRSFIEGEKKNWKE